MTKERKTLVVGIGEVGSALMKVLERKGPVLWHDIEPREFADPIGTMHFCIPYRSPAEFESTAVSYIRRFKPLLTIVNSTVVPGTTRKIAEQAGAAVAYSPIRGKHARMTEDLLRYAKFVAAPDPAVAEAAERQFASVGMKTRRVARVETLELAKLAETSYFGVLIAFAQELNRYAERVDANYSEMTEFFEEIDFLPSTKYFPGFIGGHCVIPNLHLLKRISPSQLLDAVLDSNERRAVELADQANGRPSKEDRTERDHEGKLLANR